MPQQLYEVPLFNGDRPQPPRGPWAQLRDAAVRLWHAAHAALCRLICRWG
jgi:hypothetical protein